MTTIKAFRTTIQDQYMKRVVQNIPPLPLNVEQVKDLIHIFKHFDYDIQKDKSFLLDQFSNRIVPGVDETSKLKVEYLKELCQYKSFNGLITPKHAIQLLGTMQGGYNIQVLTSLLDYEEHQYEVYTQLKNSLLIFDSFYDIEDKYKKGNVYAEKLLYSWSKGEWFQEKKDIPEKITMSVFKVPGETNTDDLSPAQDAWSRPDIPLHALSMLKTRRLGIVPDYEDKIGPMEHIRILQNKGLPIAYVGDVVGTGSSRKSATNSI